MLTWMENVTFVYASAAPGVLIRVSRETVGWSWSGCPELVVTR